MDNLVFLSKYQNLHMDRVNPENMKEVNVTVNSDIPIDPSKRLVYRYKHGYTYKPQFWGMWEIVLPPSVMPPSGVTLRNYSSAGVTNIGLNLFFHYEVDSEYINLYINFNQPFGKNVNIIGTTARLVGYTFANDYQKRDFS